VRAGREDDGLRLDFAQATGEDRGVVHTRGSADLSTCHRLAHASGSRSSGDMRARIVHLQRDKTMTVGHRVFTLLPYARRGAEALSVQREDLHGTLREGDGAGHETSRPMHVRADG